MSVIHAPGRPRLDLRILLFPGVVLLLLVGLLLRFWYVQVVLGPDLRERAVYYGETRTQRLAPRGLIFDRNGKLVAGVQSQFILTAVPEQVQRNPWVLDKVSAMLEAAGVKNATVKRLQRKVQEGIYRPKVPTPIFAGVPVSVAAKVAEATEGLPGIDVESQSTRFYPDPISFSHILGYVWVPSVRDVERAKAENRPLAALVGKGGLESYYEKDLMGVEGSESLQVDARGRPLRVAERQNPLPGSQLILGLDADVQRAAVQALGSNRGSVVALDPESGEILCMASSPGFDLTLFKNGISQEDFAELNNSSGHPFLNRPTLSAFAPGSTFKIVTTVAAIRAGVFDPNRTVFCAGGYRLGRQFFKCLGHHGSIAFTQALERSCNTYFSDLAMRTGKDALRKTALEMGFFEKTGVDLPSERSGLIPTDDWLQRVKRTWVPGYTLMMGIGQGDVLATPMQMANLAAMVATGGTTYRPHLVRGFRRSADGPIEDVQPQVLHQVDLPESGWDLIRQAMVGVVQHGTAAGSQIQGLVWAGKTGSAEVHGQAKTNSWFIGYAPADHPRIAVCVVVEAAGHGSEVAAPIAKRVVERYLMLPNALSKSASASSRR